MPAYHSVYVNQYDQKVCDFPIVSIQTNKLPVLDYKLIKSLDKSVDIIDEAIVYFRVNVLFKNFSIKNDADKP